MNHPPGADFTTSFHCSPCYWVLSPHTQVDTWTTQTVKARSSLPMCKSSWPCKTSNAASSVFFCEFFAMFRTSVTDVLMSKMTKISAKASAHLGGATKRRVEVSGKHTGGERSSPQRQCHEVLSAQHPGTWHRYYQSYWGHFSWGILEGSCAHFSWKTGTWKYIQTEESKMSTLISNDPI